MDTQDRGRLEEELGKDRLEEEDEEHHQFSSPSESINHFIATHQISFSKYQLQQINEFKQQLNDERLVVHAMKEAMSKNNDPKVELPFSYLVKILSRYVQEHFSENFERITSEGLRDGIKNYLVITDQLADNLHDFVVLFAKENDNESAKVMNNAEIKVRKAAIILADLHEKIAAD
ncbi:hypothetical protein RM023_09565 [Limosilactobacillus reuteri]